VASVEPALLVLAPAHAPAIPGAVRRASLFSAGIVLTPAVGDGCEPTPGAASCPRPGEPSVDLVEILNRIREVDGRDPFDPQGAFTIAGLSGAARMPPKRPGRPGRPLYFYAECASRYADLCALGDRDVVKRLGEEPGYSTEGVKSIISRARTLNLLTPAVRGRASGALTEEGRQSACGWPAPGRPVVLPLSSCLLEIT
jgi:hypothetical protein